MLRCMQSQSVSKANASCFQPSQVWTGWDGKRPSGLNDLRWNPTDSLRTNMDTPNLLRIRPKISAQPWADKDLSENSLGYLGRVSCSCWILCFGWINGVFCIGQRNTMEHRLRSSAKTTTPCLRIFPGLLYLSSFKWRRSFVKQTAAATASDGFSISHTASDSWMRCAGEKAFVLCRHCSCALELINAHLNTHQSMFNGVDFWVPSEIDIHTTQRSCHTQPCRCQDSDTMRHLYGCTGLYGLIFLVQSFSDVAQWDSVRLVQLEFWTGQPRRLTGLGLQSPKVHQAVEA